jgi:hypothetical protein
MGDSRLIKNIQDSVTNFETECSDAIRRSRIDDDEEIRRLEEKLEVAMQNFERNLDMELERYSTAVKEKKPSVGTPVDDRAYDAYRVVLKDANTNLNKISGWLNCIFSNLRSLIVSIIKKIRMKAGDLWDFIKREFRKLICAPF